MKQDYTQALNQLLKTPGASDALMELLLARVEECRSQLENCSGMERVHRLQGEIAGLRKVLNDLTPTTTSEMGSAYS